MHWKRRIYCMLGGIGIVGCCLGLAMAQDPPPEIPPSLKTVAVPNVPGLNEFIKDKKWAIILGKALFWDTRIGSDGQACASCHFHAGADNRTKNQLSSGLLHTNSATGETFEATASGGAGGPNYTLKSNDFPFHQFNNPADRNSGVKFTTDDVASSQGTFDGEFIANIPILGDFCRLSPDEIFNVGGIGTLKVEPLHTPSMINAVFNFRNFWDGRANNRFNGKNPFGRRDEPGDPRTDILKFNTSNGQVTRVQVDLENSSLGSQAVGPPLSPFEMSCSNRVFPDIGKKVLTTFPLADQQVHAQDSVLGPYRLPTKGLVLLYQQIVQRAFQPAWWAAPGVFDGYSQMEHNFALFWGLAVQLYESTLISDAAPFDKWREAGGDLTESGQGNGITVPGFGAQEIRGLNIFMDKGKCINCHGGPEFSKAATHLQPENQEEGLVERMLMGDGGIALYDNGFYNIGVTPTDHALGVGGEDPFGNPLSFTEQYRQILQGRNVPDPFQVDPCTFEIPVDPNNCATPPAPNFRAAVKGAFKVPILRNAELTGPYMHNGSMATLEEVVQFYNRGGNFRNNELDPDINRLELTAQEQADLVAFLKALTDSRVKFKKAPFDHPELKIPNGHPGNENSVTAQPGGSGLATVSTLTIPAVGRNGVPTALQPFHQGLN